MAPFFYDCKHKDYRPAALGGAAGGFGLQHPARGGAADDRGLTPEATIYASDGPRPVVFSLSYLPPVIPLLSMKPTLAPPPSPTSKAGTQPAALPLGNGPSIPSNTSK